MKQIRGDIITFGAFFIWLYGAYWMFIMDHIIKHKVIINQTTASLIIFTLKFYPKHLLTDTRIEVIWVILCVIVFLNDRY